MTKQNKSRSRAHGERKNNVVLETQTTEQVKGGKGMKVHETSGITNKYTGIEGRNKHNNYDRSYGEGKCEQSPRKLQKGRSDSGVVSPKYTRKERREGRGGGDRKGKEWERMQVGKPCRGKATMKIRVA